MQLTWPPELLEHPLCRPRPLSLSDGAGHVLFKGLSVRMAMATGEPVSVREHPVTRRVQYTGTVLRLAMALADAGSGGQILLEPVSFRAVAAALERLAPDADLLSRLTGDGCCMLV